MKVDLIITVFPNFYMWVVKIISITVMLWKLQLFANRVFIFQYVKGISLVAQMVKNLPAMQETQVREDPLEKGMTNHSSILVWRIP